ncbi:zf-CCHC domain-containing protein [Tanacetum coccineum]
MMHLPRIAMAVRDFKKFFRRRGKFVRQPYDEKKNFRKAKEDKKEKEDRRCFKCSDPNHFISDCPKHSFGDQKAFVVGCWSDSGDDSKKEEICFMAQSNEVQSDTPYYSSSSLDNESRQNEYDKLCKISLRIINKNKHLKAKILGSNIVKKNDSVLITRKPTLSLPKGNKQPPILKISQGHGKSRIQTPYKMAHGRPNVLYPKSNYHQSQLKLWSTTRTTVPTTYV